MLEPNTRKLEYREAGRKVSSEDGCIFPLNADLGQSGCLYPEIPSDCWPMCRVVLLEIGDCEPLILAHLGNVCEWKREGAGAVGGTTAPRAA